MAFSRDDQRDALIQAHLKWVASEGIVGASDDSRANIVHGSEDRRYMRGMGLIPQNEARRDIPRRAPRTRLAGYRQDDGTYVGTSQKVRVIHADGRTELRDADSFRKTRESTRRAIVSAPEAPAHRVNAADLAPAMVDEA